MDAQQLARRIGLTIVKNHQRGVVVLDPKSEVLEHSALLAKNHLDYYTCEGCCDSVAIGDVPYGWMDNNDGEYYCPDCC